MAIERLFSVMQNLLELISHKETIFILVNILSIVLTIIIICKLCSEIIPEVEKFIKPSQNSALFSYNIYLHLIKEKFDISKDIAYLIDKFKEDGFFIFNLVFFKMILVFDPDHVKAILNDPENINRPHIFRGMEGVIDDSVLIMNGEKWRMRRKLLNPAFRINCNDKIIRNIENHSENFVETLKRNKHKNNVNITSLVKKSSFEVILDIIMGSKIFSQHSKYFSLLDEIVQITTGIFLERLFNILLWGEKALLLTSKGRKLRRCKILFRKLAGKIISEEMAQINDDTRSRNPEEFRRKTVFDILFDYINNNPPLALNSIFDETVDIIVAGYHTTSMTLCWCMYELGKNLVVQKKVQDELDSIFNTDFERCIRKDDLNKMIYLECAIKETMRLYPVVPFDARYSNKELRLGSKIIPKNYAYTISIFHLHRNPIFFCNPITFDPDRFLPENATKIHPFAYIPFSVGIRDCIGHRFAMMKMKIYLANIFRKFNIESIGDVYPKLGGLFLNSDRPFCIKIKNR